MTPSAGIGNRHFPRKAVVLPSSSPSLLPQPAASVSRNRIVMLMSLSPVWESFVTMYSQIKSVVVAVAVVVVIGAVVVVLPACRRSAVGRHRLRRRFRRCHPTCHQCAFGRWHRRCYCHPPAFCRCRPRRFRRCCRDRRRHSRRRWCRRHSRRFLYLLRHRSS